nr:class I poly(R)-hydroxyalkanoic acid synthase [Pseudomonas sp.]
MLSAAAHPSLQFGTPALQAPVPLDAMIKIQQDFTQEWSEIVSAAQAGKLPAISDRRFAGPAWQESPVHHLTAHSYLLSSRALMRMADAVQGDEALKQRVRFAVMQWVDAMSPANFLALNPDAQREIVESGGETLRRGFANLISDIAKGRISQTDESQFQVGGNLASTPGAVVFENRLMQVIQYTPTTPNVYARPLVMIPPCINKYYILDLQQSNSVVAYLVEQGFTVFMVSWRNPLPTDTDGIERATWDEYLEEGVLKGIQVASEISRQKQVNALGFCVGGTMLASALAVARANDQDPVASLTLLTSLLDFADNGVLDIFVDENHARMREQKLGLGGLMSARELASTFSFLRPNELVWNYVVANYLKGKTPPAFDLLYWNADSTNLPGPFFTWYFRNTYLENKLKEPGALQVCGQPLDLTALDLPTYLYASKEDHIVPWRSAYASTAVLNGQQRFVLGASGHIAGVINPPAAGKRSHWVSDAESLPASADEWMDNATEVRGSWWPDWTTWLAGHSGAKAKAPTRQGSQRYAPIEPAPGRYVLARAT